MLRKQRATTARATQPTNVPGNRVIWKPRWWTIVGLVVLLDAALASFYIAYLFAFPPNSAFYARSDGQVFIVPGTHRVIGHNVYGRVSGRADDDGGGGNTGSDGLGRSGEDVATVFFFPGVPGSRFSQLYNSSKLDTLGVRVVVPERPGVGLSSPRADYQMEDFAWDVAALADDLGVDRFAVVGFSGGAPFALNTAITLGHRVTGVALLAPLYRYDEPRSWADVWRLGISNGVLLQTYAPWLVRPIVFFMGPVLANPYSQLRHVEDDSDDSDKRLFAHDRSLRESVRVDAAEFHRHGQEAFLQHGALLLNMRRAGSFHAGRVTAPLAVWHGAADALVPLSLSHAIVRDNPRAVLHTLPNTGHYGCLAAAPQALAFLLPQRASAIERLQTPPPTVERAPSAGAAAEDRTASL